MVVSRRVLIGAALAAALLGLAGLGGGGPAPSDPPTASAVSAGSSAGPSGAPSSPPGPLSSPSGLTSPSGPSSPSSLFGGAPSGPASAGASSAGASSAGASSAPAAPSRVLNVVAHPDDDLLFLSPDLADSVQSGADVRTVYLTAGDAGRPGTYWRARMSGVRAAYAQLAGVDDVWVPLGDSQVGLAGATGLALRDAPRISLVFLRLPDGGAGSGFARYGDTSIYQLWTGHSRTLATVDQEVTYTKGSLVLGIASMIRRYGPGVVRTQDFVGRVGDGDHTDHHMTAYLTRQAWQQVVPRPHLVAYQDYATAGRGVNVTGAALAAKQAVFITYSAHDVDVRGPSGRGTRPAFGAWLRRQYVLARLP